MSRKIVAGLFVLAFLATASWAFAAEKVDNVFITGLDGGYYGYTGWLGDNFDPGFGAALFFGYGITNNFAIELDYIPMVTSGVSGDDVKDALDQAYWGGVAQEFGGFGGIGLSGKLYPRERFRDADYVRVQPHARMGLGWLPLYWTYKDAAKVTFSNEDYDGFNVIYANLGGGVDFMLAKWVSLGFQLRLWKYFVMGDTVNGYAADGFDPTDTFSKSDVEGSLGYDAGLNLTFQW